jgi:AcrR family transcriptional regulator
MKRNNDTAMRKASILEAAVKVAERAGYTHMTRQAVADCAGVSGPLVQHYFGTMAKLRRAVMRKAIRDKVLIVIAQGLVACEPHAMAAPMELKLEAAGALP